MPFNETQQPEKSNLEKAKDFLKEKYESLPDSAKDKITEFRALIDNEAAKETVYKNQGNPEYAKKAAEVSLESHDQKPLDQFLRAGPDSSKISKEVQLQILETVKSTRFNTADELQNHPRNFDESSESYELVARLPEAQQQLVKEYREGMEKGYYKENIPAFIRGLPQELQKEIHDQNPDAFARSFPDSPLTTGAELQKLVDSDISSGFGGTAMRMEFSFVGRKNSVLKNPNLNSIQINQLAATFLQIGYDGKPERNPNYFAATEKVSQVFTLFYLNQNLSKENKKALVERFGKQVGVNA